MLFPIPTQLEPPASEAAAMLHDQRLDDAIALCTEQLAILDARIPARSSRPPQTAEGTTPQYQYYALTLILVNALAERGQWKPAKEALGKYRVRFPRDPWGFEAGAEVTRRDPAVKDRAAVQRAVELLEGEAARLQGKT